jgi:hypothetical protein
MGFFAFYHHPNVGVNSPWPPPTTRNKIKILQSHYGLFFGLFVFGLPHVQKGSLVYEL